MWGKLAFSCAMAALLPGSALAVPKLSVDELRQLSRRSPNVFDTFFRHQREYEDRLPHGYMDVEVIVGAGREIEVQFEPEPEPRIMEVYVAGGQISFGSVPYVWGENAGVRVGLDVFTTSLTEGGTATDAWRYSTMLFHASAFDQPGDWSGTLGVYFVERPIVTITDDGERIFTKTEVQTDTTTAGGGRFERTSESGGQTTEFGNVYGFVHGKIPHTGITGGFLFHDAGIRQLKASMETLKADIWESVGPIFVTVPQLENYQVGVQATRVRLGTLPLTLTSEATMRYEERSGVDFDHALGRLELSLFEDDPHRGRNWRDLKKFARDFHIRLSLFGSYYNIPRDTGTRDWGWGFHVEGRSIGWGFFEFHMGLGGGRNYYEDIVVLPIASSTFRYTVGFGI